jgi:hypothetical protein
MAEHNVHLSLTTPLIELMKEMAQDKETLNKMSMSRTTATYKLVDGLGTVTHKKIVKDMKNNKFSINVDECTSQSKEKVLSVMVAFFYSEIGETVTHHYASVSLAIINARVLMNTLVDMFEKDDIPWSNLVSYLSDSAGMMRGKLSGL